MLTDAVLTEWESQLLDLGCIDDTCSHLACVTARRMRVLIEVARAARVVRERPSSPARRRLDQALDRIIKIDKPGWVPI